MEKEALKHILQKPYKRELWIKTMQFLSGQKNALTIFVEPKQISLHTKKQQEIVRELIQLGTLKTTDNVELPIFEIQLQENVKIEYNRVGVNELIKDYILKDAQKGAIATYYHKDNLPQEWRFSFISKYGASDYFDEAESIETTPKKYTYIFGTPEAHRTALERLFNLKQSSFNLEDFFEAFNVEPVSKNFFKEYKNFYLDIVHHIATTDNRQIFETSDAETEKVDLEIRNFVKRLLGRLVFLYFLQKKNWLGATNKNYEDGEHNFLENLFNGDYGNIDKELFYGDWLSKIFFNALNTPNRTNDAFELPNNNSVWIPFLNGGLFEENQEPKNHKKLKIPAYMFGELFHFFNGYNFTIYENSPEDHIVAVDPEMLGNIFENLLEDNSDKGTFYTPKEIVHYMTQESLIEYLNTKSSKNRDELENLVKHQNGDAFSRENLIEIEALIDKVKICDPAIGSGAFPMGLLQEIFALKAFIHFQLGYDIWSPAKIKQDIIQNSIYGVDLEAGAVDIARLRFWLSLVVDEPTPKPLPNLDYKIMQGNSLIEEFAGIDLSKLMDDDSEMIKEQSTLDFGDDFKTEVTLFDKATKADFQKLLNKYFAPEAWEKKHKQKVDKQAVKKEINDIVEGKIHAIVHKEKLRLSKSVQQFEKDHNIKCEEDLTALNKKSKKYKTYDAEKTRLAEIDGIEQQLVEFQHTEERPYFLWHVFFANVFDQGGFDIVIGNPPYIKEYTNRNAFSGFRKSKYYKGKMDIWYGFACKALDWLNEGGIECFIAQSNWITSAGASILRNEILTRTEIKTFVDFGNYKVFQSAGIQTMIYLLKKTEKPANEYEVYYSALLEDKINNFQLTEFLDNTKVQSQYFEKYFQIIKPQKNKNEYIKFYKKSVNRIIQKVEEKKCFFLDKTEIAQGIVAPQDKLNKSSLSKLNEKFKLNDGVFVISSNEKNAMNLSPDELKLVEPYYTTNELKRYFGSPINLEWILYTKSDINNQIQNFPKIKYHLDKFKSIITSDNKPYGLHRARNENFFIGEKIISLRKCSSPTFTFSDFNCYVSQTFFVIKTNKINLKYLTTFLNSKLIAFWLRYEGKMQGDIYQVDKKPLMNIPIHKPNTYKPFIELFSVVNFLCSIIPPVSETIKNSQLALFFEEVIDGCVYELYFTEEMQSKSIAILNLVKEEVATVFGDVDFEQLDLENEKERILKLYNNLKNGEVQKRMRQFVSKSPEILKPIIQHK